MELCLRFPTFAALLTATYGDWVELPMLSPTIAPSTTTATHIFSSSFPSTITQIENTKQELGSLESTTDKMELNEHQKLHETNSSEHCNTTKMNDDQTDDLYNSFVKEQIEKINDKLTSEPHNTIRSKLEFLRQFERKLLKHIESVSKELWLDDRQARGHKYKHKGFGVELPLLTIALLTFAVFLVKIVQQVIQAMQANNLQTSQGIVPQPIRKRQKRELNLAAAMVFQYMEDFKIHHILNHDLL